mmetsp:Transcript_108681/g.132640  ORF Transcript_108681/g.132640 Transcript_108681/m.132640 type:complete len:290 (+) Transcript_108681:65-934(+)
MQDSHYQTAQMPMWHSALVVWRLLACLWLTSLLGFNHTPIAREVSGFFHQRPPVKVVLLHGSGECKPDGTCLTTHTSTETLRNDIKLVLLRKSGQRLASLQPPDRVVVEVLNRVFAIDDELTVSLHNAHNCTSSFSLSHSLPVLHFLIFDVHVPISIWSTAITPLGTRFGGFQRRVIEIGIQGKLQSFDHRHFLVDRPSVRVELLATWFLHGALRKILAIDSFFKGIHIVFLARLGINLTHLNGFSLSCSPGLGRSSRPHKAQHCQCRDGHCEWQGSSRSFGLRISGGG